MPIKTTKVYVAEKRLYTNEEGTKLVDPDRKYEKGEAGDHIKLLAVEGDELSIEQATKLGLIKAEHKHKDD